MTGWMAAPSAAAILADLGADVIKVEPPTGDPVRGLTRFPRLPEGEAPFDASFHADNRGKRSIAVAVDQPAGAEVVQRLIAETDVFVNNLLIHRQQRYGLDPDSLRSVNPRLVHATLTGYGLDGPEAARPGYDVTAFFGRSGLIDSITDPGAAPPRGPDGPGRSLDRRGHGGRGTGRAPPGRAHGRDAGGRHQPHGHGGLVDDIRHRPDPDRSPTASGPPPARAAQPVGESIPLRRRSLDHRQHAGGPLLAAVLRDRRPGRPRHLRRVGHPEETLRRHEAAGRHHRRGTCRPLGRRVGRDLRRCRLDLGPCAVGGRRDRRPAGPSHGILRRRRARRPAPAPSRRWPTRSG